MCLKIIKICQELGVRIRLGNMVRYGVSLTHPTYAGLIQNTSQTLIPLCPLCLCSLFLPSFVRKSYYEL